jgi:predicted ATPase
MIKNITLTNFKGHSNTSIDLGGKITALVGKNGTGKTSVLQALHYMSQLASIDCQTLFQYQRNPQDLVKRNSKTAAIEVTGYWGQSPREIPWSAEVTFKSSNSISGWKPTLRWSFNEIQSKPLESWKSSFNSADENVQKALRHAVYLKLNAEKLAEPSYVDQIVPRVEYDGYGLASVIAHLMNAEPERFEKLEKSIKQIIPFIEKIKVNRTKIRKIEQKIIKINEQNISVDDPREFIGQELFFDLKGASSIPAHALSEGTLLTLGLLTVLVGPNCPNLILLDDIEQGLHPRAQRDVIQVLRELSKDQTYLQIVLTTHSPYILDELAASDIWLLNNDPTGEIHAQQLQSYPEAEHALQMLTTGELWSTVGEEWVGTK